MTIAELITILETIREEHGDDITVVTGDEYYDEPDVHVYHQYRGDDMVVL